MNYREKIRKAIECPQFGNTRYGEWGALNLEKRKYIKRLLDELDSADNCVKRLYLKNKKKKEVINKAIEYIEECLKQTPIENRKKVDDRLDIEYKYILDILKGGGINE